PVPRALVGTEAVLGGVCQLEERGLECGVALDVELATLGVVALVELVHDRVPYETGVVEPGLAGRLVVLAAELEVLLPARVGAAEELGDSVTVRGESGRLEELAVVAEAGGGDVGAVADDAAVSV